MVAPVPPPVPRTYCPQCGQWTRLGYSGVCANCYRINSERNKRRSTSYVPTEPIGHIAQVPETVSGLSREIGFGVLLLVVGIFLMHYGDSLGGFVGLLGLIVAFVGVMSIIFHGMLLPIAIISKIINWLINLFKK